MAARAQSRLPGDRAPAMRGETEIRPFRPADRDALRELCCEAAFGERPLEDFGPDRELFADLMTGYHLAREPESTWVASAPGDRLVGYLTGTRDSRRRHRSTRASILPGAALRFLLRGGLLRRAPWRAAGANLHLLRGPRLPPGDFLERFPADLHLAVAREGRGRGLGTALVERFLAALGREGVPGVHASVRSDNPDGGRFFAGLGFRPEAELPALRPPGSTGEGPRRILYARPV